MHRTGPRLLVGVVATIALALTGCGSGDDGTTDPVDDTAAADEEAPTDDDTSTDDGGDEQPDDADEQVDAGDDAGAEDEPAEEEMAATVAVVSSDLGDIVADGEGRTLYMFVPDEGGEPTCTGDCAQAWPVFEGPATAGDGADASLLATATHPSGATQATYGGWPLYYFASDAAPGDVNGQGVNDVWFVLGPDGEPVRDDVAAAGVDVGY